MTVAATDHPLHILVVDDTIANLVVVEAMMDECDVRTTLCHSGVDALRLLEADHDFDGALIDIRMPGMTGIELLNLHQAAAVAQKRNPVPMLAWTANFLGNHETSFKDAGFLGHFAKPVRFEEVEGVLEFFRSRSTDPGTQITV